MPSGLVLVVGGFTATGVAIATAELYDPGTDLWSPAGTHATFPSPPSATLMPDGLVLVVGGTIAQLYNPSQNSWTTIAGPSAARRSHAAALLSNGKVLVAGGEGPANDALASAESYTGDRLFADSFD